jgi:hypothetical protein
MLTSPVNIAGICFPSNAPPFVANALGAEILSATPAGISSNVNTCPERVETLSFMGPLEYTLNGPADCASIRCTENATHAITPTNVSAIQSLRFMGVPPLSASRD